MIYGTNHVIKSGDRVVVTIEDVSATGRFVAGIGGRPVALYEVILDGTEKMIAVPKEYIAPEEES